MCNFLGEKCRSLSDATSWVDSQHWGWIIRIFDNFLAMEGKYLLNHVQNHYYGFVQMVEMFQ